MVGGAGGSGVGGDPMVASSSTGSTGGGGGETAPWAGPVEALGSIDLGTVSVGFQHTFPIPDRTLGFTLLATASDNVALGVYQLKPEGVSSVIFDFSMPNKDGQVFVDLGWVSAANPQSDLPNAVPTKEGNWSFVLGSDGSADEADVRVWARRTLDGQFHGGVLDVNVFIAEASEVKAPYLGAMLNTLFNGYFAPSFGLTKGTVTFGDLDASYGVVNTHGEYKTMLQLSDGVGAAPALNLFVIGDFSNGEFGNAIGVAGGLPGSPMVHGTGRSGVAFVPSKNTAYDARVLAHEIGHLGGLFHTTELQSPDTDSLGDTPECASEMIQGDPESCPDKSNIMFPVAYGGTQFTTDQAMVVQASALYRGILEEGGSPVAAMMLAPRSSSPAGLGTWVDVVVPEPADATEELLSGTWCARTQGYEELVLAMGNLSRVEDILLDENAFDRARSRALSVLALAVQRQAFPAAELEALAAAVLTGHAGRELAAAGIEFLAANDRQLLEQLVPLLRSRGPVIVEHLQQLGF